MSVVTIVGAQWGDEGKGKIVDIYTEFADVVVRYAGGPNAGHTLVVGDEQARRAPLAERHPAPQAASACSGRAWSSIPTVLLCGDRRARPPRSSRRSRAPRA